MATAAPSMPSRKPATLPRASSPATGKGATSGTRTGASLGAPPRKEPDPEPPAPVWTPPPEPVNPMVDPAVYFRVTAWVLAAITLLGVVLTALQQTPSQQALSLDGSFLQFTWTHNILHLVLAGACFLFGYSALPERSVRVAAIVFGAVYLLLGVLGFFLWNGPTDEVLALTPTVNVLHLLLGGWALLCGILGAPRQVSALAPPMPPM